MINEINRVVTYQVVTKHYNGEYYTKEDAERIDKLMISLEKIIDFIVKEKYLVDILDVEYPFINTKEGTCDFNIIGVRSTASETCQYVVNKEKLGQYLLVKFAICKVKNFDLSDEIATEELKRFSKVIDDIKIVFPEKTEVLNRIMQLDNIYDHKGSMFIFNDTKEL